MFFIEQAGEFLALGKRVCMCVKKENTKQNFQRRGRLTGRCVAAVSGKIGCRSRPVWCSSLITIVRTAAESFSALWREGPVLLNAECDRHVDDALCHLQNWVWVIKQRREQGNKYQAPGGH